MSIPAVYIHSDYGHKTESVFSGRVAAAAVPSLSSGDAGRASRYSAALIL
jgi:hypothetical protein